MKRLFSPVLAVLFPVSVSLPAAAAVCASPFTDVSHDDCFRSPVLRAEGGNITQGVRDGGENGSPDRPPDRELSVNNPQRRTI